MKCFTHFYENNTFIHNCQPIFYNREKNKGFGKDGLWAMREVPFTPGGWNRPEPNLS
jgi:hypothetical protein